MTHLRIEQNNIQENVSSAVIAKLYELATSGDLDASSNLAGNLHTTATYQEYIDALHTAYPDLYISATDIYIMFEDPEVLNVLLANNIGDGVGVTLAQAANANLGTKFYQNTAITSFNNFDKFTYANSHETSFKGCTNLQSINLSNVSCLGQECFKNCTSLTSLNIGGTANGIYYGVFQGCTNLQSVTLPNSFTRIRDSYFAGCTKLSTINLQNIQTIEHHAFINTKLTSVDLSNCTTLDNEVFSGCSSLQSVTLSPQLNSIPMGTFKDCSSLSSIDLSHITSIGGVIDYGAFQGCSSLTSVTLNSAITSIPTYCFCSCSSLASISGLSNVTSFGDLCFSNNSSLTTTDIDWTKVTSVGYESFYNCGITGTINATNLTSLNTRGAFEESGITSITSLGSLTTIPMRSFLNCRNLTSVTLPNTCTTLKPSCFSGCSNLVNINLQNITHVSGGALNGIGITSIVLPSIQYLGDDAFAWDNTLVSIDLGPSLTTIYGRVFWDSRNLRTIIIRATSVPSWPKTNGGYFTFNHNETIYVPDASLQDYKTAWSEMASQIKGISELPQS